MKSMTLVLSALGLLAVSSPAIAASAPPDPIAYPCYYCSYPEMEAVALSKGAGEHYVYDQSANAIHGFAVTQQGNHPGVAGFVPPRWVTTQFSAMLKVYHAPSGAFVHVMRDVNLPAPGRPHTRSNAYLWGHHTTALNVLHGQARELARRHITRALLLPYLTADVEHGRLLRFQTSAGEFIPIIASLRPSNIYLGQVDYVYERGSGSWHYLQASDIRNEIPESAEDFTGPTGRRAFTYAYTHTELAEHFIERAEWAGVKIVGDLMPGREVAFICTRNDDDRSCALSWR